MSCIAEPADRFHNGRQHQGLDRDHHKFLHKPCGKDRYKAVSVEHGQPDAVEQDTADHCIDDLGGKDPLQCRFSSVKH